MTKNGLVENCYFYGYSIARVHWSSAVQWCLGFFSEWPSIVICYTYLGNLKGLVVPVVPPIVVLLPTSEVMPEK